MKNLGKITFLLFLIPNVLFGAVSARVSAKSVSMGESITFSLNVSGENIKRPTIYTLCNSDVTSTGTQTSIQIINGSYQKTNILNYQFTPTKSCTIKSIEIDIDGVKHKTKAINIEVKPMDVAKDSAFILTLNSNKKEVFVGEPFVVTLLFKQRRDAEAVDSKFIAPELKGFWMKDESEPKRYNDGDYTVTKLSYTLSAQRSGKVEIKPAQMKIASRDSKKDSWGAWIAQIKWRTYFSNELSLDVKPLPNGVDLVGDFTIKAIADKNTINVNEAANITIEVNGDGNLEDIKSFKPFIDGVNVFDEKSVVKGHKLTQKMAFVSDRDFIVPPFTLKFFNPKTKQINTISTKAIKIAVKGAKAKQSLNIKREEPIASQIVYGNNSGINNVWIILSFIIGTLFGVLLMVVKPWKFIKKEKSFSIKDPKVLLVKLLPFKNDEEVNEIVNILEKNIYSNESIKIDKKLLKEILKKYKLK